MDNKQKTGLHRPGTIDSIKPLIPEDTLGLDRQQLTPAGHVALRRFVDSAARTPETQRALIVTHRLRVSGKVTAFRSGLEAMAKLG